MPGNRGQRRERDVHKLYPQDVPGLTREDLRQMIGTGDIELIVRGSDQAAGSGWTDAAAHLLREVATVLDAAPRHANRTVIVNLLARAVSEERG